MIRRICIFLTLLCTVLFCAGCDSVPDGNIMDGDGMVYDFVVYNIEGDWVQVTEDEPWTLHFNHDDMTFTDSDGNSIPASFEVMDGNSNTERTLTLKGKDIPCETMLFRMKQISVWNIGVLFEAESEDDEPERIYVKKEDLRYLNGIIPVLKADSE